MDNPYQICENCIFVDEPLDKDPCRECNRVFLAQRIKPNFVSKCKPKTNADRVRAMTDEELAEIISSLGNCDTCYLYLNRGCNINTSCKDAVLEWLRKEIG